MSRDNETNASLSLTGNKVLIGRGDERIIGSLVRMDTRFSTALLTQATISGVNGKTITFRALTVVGYDWIGLPESWKDAELCVE
jgi:hypothetical protein